MMVRPPRVPVDLLDPVFVSPKDVTLNLWLAEREIVNAYIAMKSARSAWRFRHRARQ
jgi:hypothetical protein